LVIARYYPDEDGNRNGTFTEYDVFVPRWNVTIRNVQMQAPYIGVTGGQQITLTPASGIPDMTNPELVSKNIADSDGDLVCIKYIGGKWPVIDGCLNHLRVTGGADWHTTSSDGAVYALTYNTTRSRIDKDGNIAIDLDDAGSHDRSLTVNVDGTQFFVIKQDGGTGDVRIELGAGAVEKLVLGETFQTWWSAALGGNIPNHTHSAGTFVVGANPVTGTSGGSTIPAFPNSNLTDKAKVEP
jgi:hypothetical protein